MDERPVHLELDRTNGLHVTWADGARHFYPVAHLRRQSPSADARELREQLAANPLTVLPASSASGPLVGNYACRIRFSDGHDTGIYSWRYLRSIAPQET
jgi:DUF971 family protein